MSLQVRAGSCFESPPTSGITNFLHRVMLRGTSKRTAVPARQSYEDIGGTLDSGGEVRGGRGGGARRSRVNGRRPRADRRGRAGRDRCGGRDRKGAAAPSRQIKARADAPVLPDLRHLLRDLYARIPTPRKALGRRETIERFTRDDLFAHYRRSIRPSAWCSRSAARWRRDRVVRAAERSSVGWSARRHAAEASAAPRGEGRPSCHHRFQPAGSDLRGYLVPGLTDPLYPAVRCSARPSAGDGRPAIVELRDRRGLLFDRVVTPFRTGPAFFSPTWGRAGERRSTEAGVLSELERARPPRPPATSSRGPRPTSVASSRWPPHERAPGCTSPSSRASASLGLSGPLRPRRRGGDRRRRGPSCRALPDRPTVVGAPATTPKR